MLFFSKKSNLFWIICEYECVFSRCVSHEFLWISHKNANFYDVGTLRIKKVQRMTKKILINCKSSCANEIKQQVVWQRNRLNIWNFRRFSEDWIDWSMSDQLAANTCDSNQTIDDNIEINLLLVLVEMDFSWTKLQWFDSKIDFIPKITCKTRNKYMVAYVQVAHLEHTVPSIIITMMQATDKLGKKLSIWLNTFINIMKLIRNLLPKIEKVVIWFLTRCGFYFNQNADMSLGWQLKYRSARTFDHCSFDQCTFNIGAIAYK